MEQEKYTILVAGRRIEVTREKRSLGELKLDPWNQRLQYFVHKLTLLLLEWLYIFMKMGKHLKLILDL